MVQNIIWKADCHLAIKKYPAFFMEPEGSSPCSQKPAIGPYPEHIKGCRTNLIMVRIGKIQPYFYTKLKEDVNCLYEKRPIMQIILYYTV
jgi:hypothetical protein